MPNLSLSAFLPGRAEIIFFGRDWKVVAQRKGWIRTLKRVETKEMAPNCARNAGAKELICWVFDKDFAPQRTDALLADIGDCGQVSLDDLLTVRRLKRFRDQAAPLFSNVLQGGGR